MMKRGIRLLLLFSGVLLAGKALAEVNPYHYAVQVSAIAQANPPALHFTWPTDPNATGYIVSRKTKESVSWTEIATLPGTATSFTDTQVSAGQAFEYQFIRHTTLGYRGRGYILAGIKAPFTETRGKIILLTDSAFTSSLAAEINRLKQDLIGDGWMVIRRSVSRSDSVATVKNVIRSEYAADPANVKAVLLFGRIPVPYSGAYMPDGHSNHYGAWPADTYYGDVDELWTDSSVHATTAERQANWNVPGDGKFDQSTPPSALELMVGRVDLSTMTCFANKSPSKLEVDLLRQYLNKDHNFRHGLLAVARKGLVIDSFGESGGDAYAASGWRNFAAFFGAGNVEGSAPGTYFQKTSSGQGYLWSYGTGGGGYTSVAGVGSSDDWALNDPKTVFTMFFGSYFGDWDNESNFLRAVLGAGTYTLTSSLGGGPHWWVHQMGLGETIGSAALLTQNNHISGTYDHLGLGDGGVHIALHGDPTLRMHPVRPPSNLVAAVGASGVSLTWSASTDSVEGYHVYRADSVEGPYSRLTIGSPITALQFQDASGTSSHTYMVRAIKLELSGSGTYYNPSQGVFAGAMNGGSTGGTTSGSTGGSAPAAPSDLTAKAVSNSQINLSWVDNSNNETGFKIYRKTGSGVYSQIALTGANITAYSDSGLLAGATYTYRIASTSGGYDSLPSTEASATTLSPVSNNSAIFVRADSTTLGTWKGNYGSEGYYISGDGYLYPHYSQFTFTGNSSWIWNYTINELPALQKVTGTSRIAACWYASSSFTILPRFSDQQVHRMALYCLDWDLAGRQQLIEVYDTETSAILNSQTISNFGDGIYLVWDVKGSVGIRVKALKGPNAVVSGLFFDPAGTSNPPPAQKAATPVIQPNGGNFDGSATVTLSSTTSGSSIRYTLDGSTPNSNSILYTQPFILNASATVTARAFAQGLADSDTAWASFTIKPNQAIPTITPGGGTYNNSVSVSLSSTTEGTTLRYTLDGSTPTSTSTTYTGPFLLTNSATVKARGFKAGFVDSATALANFNIVTPSKVSTPTISPNGGSYSGSVTVSIATATTGATIRYTLDGTTPTTVSPLYQGPFTMTNSATVNARAYKSGMTESSVMSASFMVSPATSGTQVAFAGLDSTTKGSWKGIYGNDGYLITGDNTSLPGYAKVTYSGNADHIWVYNTADLRGVQKMSTTSRLAATAYASGSFNVGITVDPGVTTRVSFYSLDWDRLGRNQKIEVIDTATGAILDTRTISNFQEGVYLHWDISGKVTFRFTRTGPANAVLSALFFTRN